MRKKWVYILLLILLIGCQSNSAILLYETNENNLKKEVKAFIERNNSNGIYLYSNLGKTQYLIINRNNVVQGEQASYIKSIQSEILDNTLVIKLEEGYTSDYSDSKLGNRVFELKRTANDYDTIQIYLNNKETSINVIGN